MNTTDKQAKNQEAASRRSGFLCASLVLFLILGVLSGCASTSPAPSSPKTSSTAPPSSAPSTSAGSTSGAPTQPSAAGASSSASSTQPPSTPAARSGAKTEAERVAELDGTLAKSVGEFDRMLLKEQETLEQKREQVAEAQAARTGAWGGRGEAGAFDDQGSSGGEGGNAQDATDADGSSEPSVGGEQEGRDPRPEGDAAQRAERTPEDVGDGSDDDIVARQLREAALAEDDPTLREKLWQEYRRYKSGGDDE